MIRMRRVVIGLGLVIVTAGCYEHTFTVGQGAPMGPVVYQEWQNQWLGGLIGDRDHDIGQLCPSGNATIHDEQSFLNGLVQVLTGGIYSPTTVTIRCASGRSEDIDLTRGEVMAIVTSTAFMQRVERLLPDRLEETQLGVRALQQDHQD